LVKKDPGNARWLRELTLSLTKIGDVLRAQSNVAGVLQHRRRSQTQAQSCSGIGYSTRRWSKPLVDAHGIGANEAALRLFADLGFMEVVSDEPLMFKWTEAGSPVGWEAERQH
jgi:hypothetical protein